VIRWTSKNYLADATATATMPKVRYTGIHLTKWCNATSADKHTNHNPTTGLTPKEETMEFEPLFYYEMFTSKQKPILYINPIKCYSSFTLREKLWIWYRLKWFSFYDYIDHLYYKTINNPHPQHNERE